MNTYENCVREFAYQIWESEGRPIGQDSRHWHMACKLAEGLNNEDADPMSSRQVLSVITPDESDPVPDIDPPVDPIAPVEDPSRISPTIPTQPINPTDPVQPNNPAKPIQPYTSKRTSAATKSALDEDAKTLEKKTKPASKSAKNKSRKQDPVIL